MSKKSEKNSKEYLIGVILILTYIIQIKSFGGLNPNKIVIALTCGSTEELKSGDNYILKPVNPNILKLIKRTSDLTQKPKQIDSQLMTLIKKFRSDIH